MSYRSNLQQASERVRRCCLALQSQPDGLFLWELLDRIDDRDIPMSEKYQGEGSEDFRRSLIAPINAGWIAVSVANRASLTAAGREAMAAFPDPAQFLLQAARRSRRGYLSLRFPRGYAAFGTMKDRLLAEMGAVRRIGPARVLSHLLGHRPGWQKSLPVQVPRRVAVDGFHDATILRHLIRKGVQFSEGGHAVYLSPSALATSPFRTLAAQYPAGAGLKIVKASGGFHNGKYTASVSRGDSRLHLAMIPGHGQLMLIAALLRNENLGQRLYDVLELACGENIYTAYVVEHIQGNTPSMLVCERGVNALRALEANQIIKALPPEGFDDDEFACPSCANNAMQDAAGNFRYIDFQNFMLLDYATYLAKLQPPGTDAASADACNAAIAALQESGIDLREHHIRVVGRSPAAVVEHCLRNGARWCDIATPAAGAAAVERWLLARGCTRFSIESVDAAASVNDSDASADRILVMLDPLEQDSSAARWLRRPWSSLVLASAQLQPEEHIKAMLKHAGVETPSLRLQRSQTANAWVAAV